MVNTSSSRPGRALAFGVLVLLVSASLPPASAMVAAEPGSVDAARSRSQLVGFDASPASVRVGGSVWDTVTVRPQGGRPVIVQYRRSGAKSYSTASRSRTTVQGVFAAEFAPPSAGVWQYRLLLPATSSAAALVSPSRTVRAAGRATRTELTGFDGAPTTVGVGDTVTDSVTLAPGGRRPVWVQGRAPGSAAFTTVSTSRSSASGDVTAVYRPTAAGTWAFRLVVPATATARRVTSPARSVTATASTAAGSASSPTQVPQAPATAPSTPSGDPTPGPSSTPAVTTAALTVNGSTGTARASLGGFWDVAIGGSTAGAGRAIVSGSLDPGDGSPPEEFTGPPDTWLPSDITPYAAEGQFTATLTVTDDQGSTDTDSVLVTVFPAPTATLAVDELKTALPVNPGEDVNLTAASGTPGGTAITDYIVTTDEGQLVASGTGAPPASVAPATFTTVGIHTVSLIVFNDAEGWASATVEVDVVANP